MDLINIKSPADLKGLSISELTDLTAQARQALNDKGFRARWPFWSTYGRC